MKKSIFLLNSKLSRNSPQNTSICLRKIPCSTFFARSTRFFSNEKSKEEPSQQNVSNQNPLSTESPHSHQMNHDTKPKTLFGLSTLYPHNLHEFNQYYENIEISLMKRINESNRRRFRFVVLGVVIVIGTISTLFGERIRKKITTHTADIAKETLEDENLKIQTQELATAVVQTILNDKEVTSQAAAFLREASIMPETQQALLHLTLHVLQHPDSLKETTELLKQAVLMLSKDKETIAALSSLFSESIKDPQFQSSLIQLFSILAKDPEILQACTNLTLDVLSRTSVLEATNSLLAESTQTVLQDPSVVSKSKEFVGEVVGDATLQREGGDALLNSVYLALKPSSYRIVGVGLLVGSMAIAKILLSPF